MMRYISRNSDDVAQAADKAIIWVKEKKGAERGSRWCDNFAKYHSFGTPLEIHNLLFIAREQLSLYREVISRPIEGGA
jgi:hypothetical protein